MARDLPAVKNGLETVENGRDARGRFLPGNPGGGRHVNVFARYQAQLRGALLAEVAPADVRAILRQVIKIAKRGHLPAVELLLKWILGGPPPVLDPDQLDLHERQVRTGRLTMIDHLASWEDSTPPAAEAAATDEPDDTDASAAVDDPEAPDPLNPSLRTTLAWAIEELAAAQTALRAQRPLPPNPADGWETFAASRLEFAPEAAVDVDRLLVAYLRWCESHGEPVWREADLLTWLMAHGGTLRTGPVSQVTAVAGVRVVD